MAANSSLSGLVFSGKTVFTLSEIACREYQTDYYALLKDETVFYIQQS
jgi:hypothetical protein